MSKSTLKSAAAAAAVLLFSTAVYAAPADQPGHARPAQGTTNDTASAVKDTAGHVVGDISAEMTTTLNGFVAAAATSDMYEVEAGRIAADRAQDPKVKAFAAKMVKAHTATTAKLKATLAGLSPNGAPVTPPAHLDDRRQGMIDELRGAKAQDFDNRYLAQQVNAHKEALILMRGYANDGDLAPVKKFAATTAGDVQMHLDMAQHLSEAGR